MDKHVMIDTLERLEYDPNDINEIFGSIQMVNPDLQPVVGSFIISLAAYQVNAWLITDMLKALWERK